MRVTASELVGAFKGKGDAFEGFVHALVRAVGRSCGIDLVNIDWDYRTNVKDGGRDLVVRVPNPRADEQFIPGRRSIWSIKSGGEGIKPNVLRREILSKKHPKVREALQDGWAYVWCTVYPADHDQRKAMQDEADTIADKLKVDRALVKFRWPDHLEGKVNLFPNLISVHLPGIASRLRCVQTLQEWGRDPDMAGNWVEFGGRGEVVQRIVEHLLSRVPPNVLHIAGLSGVGKTRTAYEACCRSPELCGVFYTRRLEDIDLDLYRYLVEDGRHVYLVIDETPLDRLEELTGQVTEFADRVRVVTIGPAPRQPPVAGGAILLLPEPDTEAGVREVIRASGAGLSDEVSHSIAAHSGHDLRLARLLVRASQKLPEFRGVPVVNSDGVWQRLMGLFAPIVGDSHDFRRFYEVLTVAIDVGVADDVGDEIVTLAQHFQHPVEHIREATVTAQRCGLGISTRRFFEAAPRALAARLFAERVWPRVRDNLENFFPSLPERLGRRFLERCHDCTGATREEVMARLGDFFLRSLAGQDVTVLTSREASRLFQTWAEFDPDRGMSWLRRAVERATPEQLRALDGSPDGSGGWRGRRQLVWLCQNLASFAEHFEVCEAVLYRLALQETEPSIGNNSTAIWQSLFWPALAGTNLPFARRLPILIRHLRTAAADELPLVLGAAIGCVEHRLVGQPLPPQVVGGRVVPPFWWPETHEELLDLRRNAGLQVISAIAEMPGDRAAVARVAVAEHLWVFIGLGLLDRLRTLFPPDTLDDSLRRRLIAGLEGQIAFRQQTGSEQKSDSTLGPLRDWLTELSPPDLAARVRDLTARDYWSVWQLGEQNARYDCLASELITEPEAVRGLADWFDTPEAQSANPLGFSVGRHDGDARLADIVREWLRVDRCRGFTVGYLSGIAARERGLPGEWAGILDRLATDRPELTAIATASADISNRGFDRVFGLLDRLPPPVSRFLRPLTVGDWLAVPRPEQRKHAAGTLMHLAEVGDPEAVAIGLDLIRMWAHVDPTAFDQDLACLALGLAGRAVLTDRRRDLYTWRKVLELLCPFYPRQVAELIVNRITEPDGSGIVGMEEDLEVLIRAAADKPSEVMEVVGGTLLDRDRRTVFGIASFRGLFEAIGQQHVAAWLGRHGREYLRWLARHFHSPYLDETERPVVPPLTEWLFRENESDDRAFEWFLMGRSSLTMKWEGEIDPARKRQEMQPFLEHELRRVREWAEDEIRREERSAAWFREMDEEDERR